MSKQLGDVSEDVTIDFKFTTVDSDGAPATLSGTPAISVYKANGTTESTAGITLTADFDSVTGLNHVRIDTSADAFYATGNDYQVVITTGTVGGTSVVGYVVAEFSIENRNPDANVTQWKGTAPADLADTDKLQVSVQHTASALTFDLTGSITGNLSGSVGSVTGAVGSVTGNVGGNVVGSVGSISGITFPSNFADLAITATTGKMTVGTNDDKTGYSISGTKTTLDDLNDVSTAQVNSEVDTALADIHLDHLIQSADPGSIVADSSLLAKLASKSATPSFASYNNTTDSLEAIRDNQAGADASAIADAVWDEARADHTTAGTFGEGVASVQGDVTGNVDGSVASVTGNVGGNVVGSVASVTGNVGGNVVGSVGSISGVTFPSNFADLTISATAGLVSLAADQSSVTIGTVTNLTNLPAIPTGWLTADGLAADAVTEIQSGLATSAELGDGTVVVGTINDGAVGSAVVADIFSTTALTEAYAADGAAGTPAQILYLIQQTLTEFAIASTTKTVKKLDGSTTAATLTLDDDTSPTSLTRAT